MTNDEREFGTRCMRRSARGRPRRRARCRVPSWRSTQHAGDRHRDARLRVDGPRLDRRRAWHEAGARAVHRPRARRQADAARDRRTGFGHGARSDRADVARHRHRPDQIRQRAAAPSRPNDCGGRASGHFGWRDPLPRRTALRRQQTRATTARARSAPTSLDPAETVNIAAGERQTLGALLAKPSAAARGRSSEHFDLERVEFAAPVNSRCDRPSR